MLSLGCCVCVKISIIIVSALILQRCADSELNLFDFVLLLLLLFWKNIKYGFDFPVLPFRVACKQTESFEHKNIVMSLCASHKRRGKLTKAEIGISRNETARVRNHQSKQSYILCRTIRLARERERDINHQKKTTNDRCTQ